MGVASVSFVQAPQSAVAETIPADYSMRITAFANMPHAYGRKVAGGIHDCLRPLLR